MKNVNILIAITATLSFAMLTACGEGFKGSKLLSQENHEQIQRGEDDITPGVTAPAVDEQVVEEFAEEVAETGNAANASLAGQIEALSMTRTEVDLGNGNMDVTYRVRLLFGCDSNEELVASSMVDQEALQSGETVSLGRNSMNTHEFLLACTDSECGESVVTVRSIDPTGVNAVVHYGMKDEGMVTSDLGGRMRVYEYTTRRNNLDNFYTEATVAWYLEQCLLSDAESQLGEGLSGNGSIDDDLFGNGSGSDLSFTTGDGSDDDLPFTTGADDDSDDDNLFWWGTAL